MRWAVDFVDNLLYLKWQEAVKDLREMRDPIEKSFFDEQETVDKTYIELAKQNPEKGKEYLTKLTIERQEKVLKMFQALRIRLITKYTNNKQGI
jgi:dipeptidase